MGLKRSQNKIPECRHAKNKAPDDFLKVMLHETIHNDGFLQKKKQTNKLQPRRRVAIKITVTNLPAQHHL